MVGRESMRDIICTTKKGVWFDLEQEKIGQGREESRVRYEMDDCIC